MSFFEELKRRNVVRVGIAYAVAAWLLLQIADVLIDNIGAPDWVFPTLLMVLGIGFPLALIFAWAFELTPEGLKRESEVDRSRSTTRQTSRKLDRVIIGVLVIALGYFIYESRFKAEVPREAAQPDIAAPPIPPAVTDARQPVESGNEDHAPRQRSVAVLPFVNMSPDEAQEYFSDGVTEEIINAVVKIPGIAVPARTSVFAYKGRQLDLRQVGAELGVSHILEGSIRSQGDQVRITAQLIEADDGFHLWSETYDRTLDDIFAVQEEIAAAIAAQLVGKLDGNVQTVPNQTRNMAAYDLYLQGRAALRRRSDEAQNLLEQAIEADPNFAPAYAALAIALNATHIDNDRAVVLADRALALDPSNVDALNAKAAALRSRMQWAESEAVFERALAIDPNSAELLEDWAEFLAYVGRVDEALEVAQRGVEIDAALMPMQAAYIEALLSTGRPEEAKAVIQDLSTRPENRGFAWYAGLDVWLDPRIQDRGEVNPKPLTDLEAVSGAWKFAAELLDRYLGSGPDRQFTATELDELKALYAPGRIDQGPYVDAIARKLLISAGEIEYVIATDLSRFDTSDLALHELQWVPAQAPLRAHPDFGRYLEKANIVAYWDQHGWPDFCRRVDDTVRCQ